MRPSPLRSRTSSGRDWPDPVRARALLAGFDVELDPLTTLEAVEAQLPVQSRPVEEIFDTVLGGDETEPPVRNHPLDCSERHSFTLAPTERFTIAEVTTL